MKNKSPILVYDEDCPVCTKYVRSFRLKEEGAVVNFVGARRSSNPILKELAEKNIDTQEGMVLITGDTTYHSAEAIHQLALLGSNTGFFNKINHAIFSSKKISHVLYPILKFLRSLLLKLLGIKKISHKKKSHRGG